MRRIVALLGAWLLGVSASPPPVALDLILGDTLPPKLSDFRFFEGRPANGVRKYELVVPLFSDYALKDRFVYVPKGKKIRYTESGVFEFPVGTALIKTFGYIDDPRMHAPRMKPIETRVLLHRASGWVDLPYVWNADGTDAVLARAGKRLDVSWKQADGTTRSISYAVPNANQCKGCHDRAGKLTPIGPKARNLNDGNQLYHWHKDGILDRYPANIPAFTDWRDVEVRARAYLEINCAHCHNREGPANTSGLWLDWDQPRDVNFGIGKRPTAAGRGAGDNEFTIAPGHPEASILIYRMQSLDPGVAMPELGRATVDEEGVALLSEWIRTLK